jgi:cytochrome c556
VALVVDTGSRSRHRVAIAGSQEDRLKQVGITGALIAALGIAVAACSGAPDSGNNAAGTAAAGENPREAKFKAIGKANKSINEELKKASPSIDSVRTNAAAVADLASQLPGWFPAGSGAESGIETAALPAIWEKPEEFRKAAASFDARAKALVTATTGTDIAAIRTAATELGGTCKACHDQFRQKK